MFEVGSKARCDINDQKVEILYGPFMATASQEAYLVKWLGQGVWQGRSSIVWVCDLKSLPKFEVGQEVKFTNDDEVWEVVAGPFPSEGDNLWVIKDSAGLHYSSTEEYMTPVV